MSWVHSQDAMLTRAIRIFTIPSWETFCWSCTLWPILHVLGKTLSAQCAVSVAHVLVFFPLQHSLTCDQCACAIWLVRVLRVWEILHFLISMWNQQVFLDFLAAVYVWDTCGRLCASSFVLKCYMHSHMLRAHTVIVVHQLTTENCLYRCLGRIWNSAC